MPGERLTSWGWAGLGLAGTLLVAATGPNLFGGTSTAWWFTLHLPADRAVFYAGMAALCIAWLGLGWNLRRGRGPSAGALVLVGALWCLPLLVAPPLFSHDVYSYMAQGEILHLGLNPYHHAPDVLGRLGHEHLLATVSPFWRATTSPYGPLFNGVASVIMGAVGSNLILGVLLMRLLEVAGLALVAIFVPRLARALGMDPAQAVWLALISPLVLLELVAAGHNDALMIGLLVAGVTLAMERRPLLGIALCAVATAIKLPAAAGIVFIAVVWARDEWSRGPRPALAVLALSAATVVAVLGAVSVATGLGLSWVTSGVLSTPGKVHLAITPVTATGWSLASLLHLIGVSASSRGIESALGAVALVVTVALGLAFLRRARYPNMVQLLGVLLLVSVFAGPATWPWYLTWGLALVACCPLAGRSWALPVAVALAVFLVKPNGILALPLGAAPYVLGLYALAAAGVIWRYRSRHDDGTAPGRLRVPAREHRALINS